MGFLTQRNFADIRLGLLCAQLVRAVRDGDVTGIRNLVIQDSGNITKDKYLPATADLPPWYYASYNGGGLFVMSGCQTLQHAGNLVTGWLAGSVLPGNSPFNTFVEAQANYITGVLNADNINHGATFIGTGHSLGGAIAHSVVYKTELASPATQGSVQSFGAPKSGSFQTAKAFEPTDDVRYMWTSDPVPLVPFTLADAPWFVARLTGAERRSWPQWCHVRGGVELRPVGNPIAAILPSGAAASPFTSLAVWLLSQDQGPNTYHSIEVYIGQLSRLLPPIPGGTLPTLRLGSYETPNPTSSRELTRAERAVVSTIVNNEEIQNAVPVVVPKVNAFTCERDGRLWIIAFGGVTVAIAARRKYAHGLCRQLNDGLERLQRAPVVDPAALQAQLGEYLAAAQVPAGPFRPTMQTSFGV